MNIASHVVLCIVVASLSLISEQCSVPLRVQEEVQARDIIRSRRELLISQQPHTPHRSTQEPTSDLVDTFSDVSPPIRLKLECLRGSGWSDRGIRVWYNEVLNPVSRSERVSMSNRVKVWGCLDLDDFLSFGLLPDGYTPTTIATLTTTRPPTTPKPTTHRITTPRPTMSQPTTTYRPTTSQQSAPLPTTPTPTKSQPTTPEMTTPQPTTTQSTTHKPTTPTPQMTTPRWTTPYPRTPQSTKHQLTTPKQTTSTPQLTTPNLTTLQPTTPQSTTPYPPTTSTQNMLTTTPQPMAKTPELTTITASTKNSTNHEEIIFASLWTAREKTMLECLRKDGWSDRQVMTWYNRVLNPEYSSGTATLFDQDLVRDCIGVEDFLYYGVIPDGYIPTTTPTVPPPTISQPIWPSKWQWSPEQTTTPNFTWPPMFERSDNYPSSAKAG